MQARRMPTETTPLAKHGVVKPAEEEEEEGDVQ